MFLIFHDQNLATSALGGGGFTSCDDVMRVQFFLYVSYSLVKMHGVNHHPVNRPTSVQTWRADELLFVSY